MRATLTGSTALTVGSAVAVAGTPTQCAAIDLELEPYDRRAGRGARAHRAALEALRDRLAAVPLAERVRITGLDPARAPVIVAGVVILLEVLAAYGLETVAVSERDILWGVALSTAGAI